MAHSVRHVVGFHFAGWLSMTQAVGVEAIRASTAA